MAASDQFHVAALRMTNQIKDRCQEVPGRRIPKQGWLVRDDWSCCRTMMECSFAAIKHCLILLLLIELAENAEHEVDRLVMPSTTTSDSRWGVRV